MPKLPATPSAPSAPLRQRLRRRLAALSLVGAVMVALPLVQVLRYQSAEVRALLAERAGLDPVARAVQVQRGLIEHRDVAGQVLRGRVVLEPQRRLREGEVDSRTEALAVALAAGQWERASRESDALREDWARLARRIAERSIDGDASDEGHALLLEQTLQVIDFVADVAASHAALAPERTQALLRVALGLPHLAARMALLARTEGAAPPAEVRAAEAALARLLAPLDAAPGQVATQAAGLADAIATLRARSGRSLALLRSGAGRPTDISAAGAAALQAQWRFFDLARAAVNADLAARATQVGWQRTGLLGSLAGLALAALSLAWGLWHAALGRDEDAPPPAGGALPAERQERAEAGRLLQRLRGAAPAIADDLGSAGRADRSAGQPTLPPAA